MTTPQPPPALRAMRAGGTVVISWSASALGFVLQAQQALAPAKWADDTNPVAVVGLDETVTLFTTKARQFFRLRGF